jgi:hypothetical protein
LPRAGERALKREPAVMRGVGSHLLNRMAQALERIQ